MSDKTGIATYLTCVFVDRILKETALKNALSTVIKAQRGGLYRVLVVFLDRSGASKCVYFLLYYEHIILPCLTYNSVQVLSEIMLNYVIED